MNSQTKNSRRISEEAEWTSKSGAIISEFLILAPLLIALLYGCFMINGFLQKRRNLNVAARNTAYLSSQDSTIEEAIENSNSYLANKSSLMTNTIEMEVSISAVDGGDSDMTRGVRRLDQKVVEKAEDSEKPHGFSVDDRLGVVSDEEGPYGVIDSIEANLTKIGSRSVLDTLAKLHIPLTGNYFFIDDSKIRSVSLKLKEGADADLFSKGLILAHQYYEKKPTEAETDENFESLKSDYELNLESRFFLRPETGRFPDSYSLQTAHGYIGSKLSTKYNPWFKFKKSSSPNIGKPGDYVQDCMMHFEAKDDCSKAGVFPVLVELIGVIAAVLSIPTLGFKDLIGEVVTSATEEGISSALQSGIDYTEDQIGKIGEDVIGPAMDGLTGNEGPLAGLGNLGNQLGNDGLNIPGGESWEK